MHTPKTQLQKQAEKIRMSSAERRNVRERLISYMEYHPLTEVSKKSTHDIAKTNWKKFVQANVLNYRFRVVGTVFAVVLIAGIPFAAEQSLPGDTLYPVKVRLNENLRSQLSLTPYQKVAWDTRVVERRIAEARLLASEGKLTQEAQETIEEGVRKHTKAAQKELAALHESDADEAVVAQAVYESALDVQTAVLDTAGPGGNIEGISNIVKAAKTEVSTKPDFASSTPSYTNFVGRVEAETTRARELFESINGAATEEEKTDILRRIEDGERTIARARELHEQEDVDGAISVLKQTLSNIQKIIVFMTDIDVRTSVALETLVPKDLTDEEKEAFVLESLNMVRNIENALIERAPEVTDEAVIEEVALGMEALAALILAIEEALASNDVAQAEELAVDALALANTLDAQTAPNEETIENGGVGEAVTEKGTEEETTGEAAGEGQVEGAETEEEGESIETDGVPTEEETEPQTEETEE